MKVRANCWQGSLIQVELSASQIPYKMTFLFLSMKLIISSLFHFHVFPFEL